MNRETTLFRIATELKTNGWTAEKAENNRPGFAEAASSIKALITFRTTERFEGSNNEIIAYLRNLDTKEEAIKNNDLVKTIIGSGF